jgi:cysteinyl-tRNA synthetase
MKYLGNHFENGSFKSEKFRTIDIHTGAEDLIFPHHENEIAQSEGATGEKFVNVWIHGGHLQVEGRKMARREGNFHTLSTIEEWGFQPLAFRYLTLTAHYRSRLNFTWDSMTAAQNALNNLYSEIYSYNTESSGKDGKDVKEFEKRFAEAIDDDLDIPRAITVVWDVVRSDLTDKAKLGLLKDFDKVLGLDLDEAEKHLFAEAKKEDIEKLINQREEARAKKYFKKSDEIRDRIAQLGFEVEDTSKGPKLRKISKEKDTG